MKKAGFFLAIAASIILISACEMAFSKTFRYPLGAAKLSEVSDYVILDLSSVLAGTRRLGADIAWVQLLQYYGSPEKPVDKETEYEVSIDMTKHIFGINKKEEPGKHHEEEHYHQEIEGGVYPDLLKYCYRIVDLDPYFFYVYLYGSGALAWNLNRGDEALELLGKGIENMERYRVNITRDLHQPFWQFNLYVSAILYRKKGESEKMVSLLDTAAHQPEAPNLVKVILANIYQNSQKYQAALELWTEVRDSGDPWYSSRSREKIKELKELSAQKE